MTAYMTSRKVSRWCKGEGLQAERLRSTGIDVLNFNTTRYSRVKISEPKQFLHVTERSSWKFRITIVWQGETKDEAEQSEKKSFATSKPATEKIATKKCLLLCGFIP
ncbi:unnamed protein product [Ectocarpus sp. 6 AP-2014]